MIGMLGFFGQTFGIRPDGGGGSSRNCCRSCVINDGVHFVCDSGMHLHKHSDNSDAQENKICKGDADAEDGGDGSLETESDQGKEEGCGDDTG